MDPSGTFDRAPDLRPAIRVEVGPVLLPIGGSVRVGVRLLRYQEEVLSAGEKFLAVDAPTGAGKTLAAALKAVDSMDGSGTAMFVYPTNALVEDQVRSVVRDLGRCGIAAEALDPTEPKVSDSTEILVSPISSHSLDELASSLKVGTHGEALSRLRTEILPRGTSLFLMTNPEMMFTLLKGHPSFRGHSTLLREFLMNLSVLVVDEFHLYFGFSLANLLSSLHLIWRFLRRVLLLSATPSLLGELVGRRGGRVIRADPGDRGMKVRHETLLYLKSISSGKPLWGEDDAGKMIPVVKAFLEWSRNEAPDSEVKVLVLVNSVVFAERLYRKLRDALKGTDVVRVHGFIPADNRRFTADVVVGTRARDVGVDFDAAAVIFEALSASDFVQRLGRGGRRRPGLALALVPGGALMKFREALKNRGKIGYEELVNLVRRILPEEETYWHEVSREIGAASLLAAVHGLNSVLRGWGEREAKKRENVEDSKKALEKLLEEDMGWLAAGSPGEAISWAEDLLELSLSGGMLSSLVESGMRGTPLPVRAFFREFGTWGEVDVMELWRAEFSVKSDEEGLYVEVEGPGPGKRPKLIVHGGKSSGILLRFKLSGVDERLGAKIADIMKEKVIYVAVEGSRPADWDWRIPALPGRLNGRESWIAVGPDSLLLKLGRAAR